MRDQQQSYPSARFELLFRYDTPHQEKPAPRNRSQSSRPHPVFIRILDVAAVVECPRPARSGGNVPDADGSVHSDSRPQETGSSPHFNMIRLSEGLPSVARGIHVDPVFSRRHFLERERLMFRVPLDASRCAANSHRVQIYVG